MEPVHFLWCMGSFFIEKNLKINFNYKFIIIFALHYEIIR